MKFLMAEYQYNLCKKKMPVSTLFIKSDDLYIMFIFNRSLITIYDAYFTCVLKISSHFCLNVCFLLTEGNLKQY